MADVQITQTAIQAHITLNEDEAMALTAIIGAISGGPFGLTTLYSELNATFRTYREYYRLESRDHLTPRLVDVKEEQS